MDTLSHGLWGGIAVGRKSRGSFLLAFLFGTAPDLFSFGLLFVGMLLGIYRRPDFSGPPDVSIVPSYIHQLYNMTHSLVVFFVVFALVWIVRRKPWWVLSAWGLHILFDIPTHSSRFYPTPFLWPLSSFHVGGIPWSSPVIFFPNWVLLIILYGIFFLSRRFRKDTVV